MNFLFTSALCCQWLQEPLSPVLGTGGIRSLEESHFAYYLLAEPRYFDRMKNLKKDGQESRFLSKYSWN